jgi:HEAT repeat protein
MGKCFVSLIVAIIVIMGVVGLWLLNSEGHSRESQSGTSLYAQEIAPSDRSGTAQTTTQDQSSSSTRLDRPTQQKLLAQANNRNTPNREAAILKLMEVEQDLAMLVPALARLLSDSNESVQIASAIVLEKIGRTGAEHLKSMMESSNLSEVAIACSAIKEMGGADLYLPLMKKWLTSEESGTRKLALFALQGSKQGVLDVLPEVTATLEDKDFNVQGMACRVLTKLGPDGLDSVDQVLQLHKTGNPSARSLAAVALGAIGPNTKFDTAEYLASTLDAFMQLEKQRSLEGLALMGHDARAVAESVRETMRDKNKRVMPDAAYTLWRITGETDEPLQVIADSLNDPSHLDFAIDLAGKMGAAAEPLVGKLVALLKEAEMPFQEKAAIALGNIGPAAADSLSSLNAILEDKSQPALLRFYAKEAVEKIDGSHRK